MRQGLCEDLRREDRVSFIMNARITRTQNIGVRQYELYHVVIAMVNRRNGNAFIAM